MATFTRPVGDQGATIADRADAWLAADGVTPVELLFCVGFRRSGIRTW